MAINEYDELAKNLGNDAAPAPAANPYLALVQDEAQQTSSAVKQSMYVAAQGDPDRKAKVLELSQKMNLPPNVVETNFDDLQKKASVEPLDYDGLAKNLPGTANFLTSPDNATLAKDDIKNLKQYEETVHEQGALSKAYDSLAKGLHQTYANVGKVPAYLYDAYYFPANMVRKFKGEPQIQAPEELRNNDYVKQQQAYADSFKVPELEDNILNEIKAGNYGKAGRALFYQFVNNAPQQAITIAGAMSGVGEAALVGTSVMSAADKADQNAKKGVDPVTGTMNATVHGAFEGAFEYAGTFGILKKWEGVIAKQVGKEASKEVFKDFAKTLAYSALAEGNEEAFTSLAQDLNDYATGVNPELTFSQALNSAANAGILGATSGVLLTAPSGIGAGRYRHRQVQQAQMAKDVFQSLGNTAEAMKLRERLPQKAREFVESVTKDGPLEHVFISPEAIDSYFQDKGESPVKMMGELGVSKEYDEAKQTGADVKIPLSVMTEKLVGTEHYQGLADDIKFDPKGKSINELKVEKERTAEELKKIEEENAKLPPDEREKAQAELDLMENEMEQKLSAAGYSPQEIKPNVAVWSNMLRVMAHKTGQSPYEMFKRFDIRREEDVRPTDGQTEAQGRAFNQAQVADVPPMEMPEGMEILPYKGSFVFFNSLKGVPVDPVTNKETLNLRRFKSIEEAQRFRSERVGSQREGDGKSFNQSILPGFYSKLQQTIEQKMGAAQEVASLKAMLREIKPEEMKWSGIDEFLKGKEKVSKTELLEFLRANQLEIKEVEKGGEQPQITVEDFNSNYEVSDMEVDGLEAVHSFNVPEALADTIEHAEIEEFKDGFWVNINGNSTGTQYNNMEKAILAIEEYVTNRAGIRFAEKVGQTDSTKFSQYTLPGGENYREVLLTLPPKSELTAEEKEFLKGVEDRLAAGRNVEARDILNKKDLKKYDALTERRFQEGKKDYKSSHWEEPNVLAHVRLNDRVDADGKRVLFVEEIQSDWHQAGRKKGYIESAEGVPVFTDDDKARLRSFEDKILESGSSNEKAVLGNDYDEYRRLVVKKAESRARSGGGETIGRVPDAPFRKTWHEFAFKRILRMAAEGGYDRVAWTTGEQQADRYDLSKQVSELNVFPNKDGTYDVTGRLADRAGVQDFKRGIRGDELSDVIGKELAEKAIAQSKENPGKKMHQYRGVDLKVGGEGMKGFYDKILVSFADKFGKKYGAKVSESKIEIGKTGFVGQVWRGETWTIDALEEQAKRKLETVRYNRQLKAIAKAMKEYNLPFEQAVAMHGSPGLAEDVLDGQLIDQDKIGTEKVHSLDITPQLKEAALNEGFSLFQDQGGGPRGKIAFFPNKKVAITLFKDANLSTFLHEMGHFYLESMAEIAKDPGAPEQIKEDFKTILKFLGLDSSDQIQREHHEIMARAFEAYLMEGKAPSEELRSVFTRIKMWMLDVYKSLRALDVEMSDEIRGVFARALATDHQILAAYHEQNIESLFGRYGAFKMNDEMASKYDKALEAARLAAEDKLRAEVMKDILRQKQSEWKAEEAKIRPEVEAEVNARPVYKALSILQKGVMPDGSPLPDGMPAVKLDRKAVDQTYGKDFYKTLPKGIFAPKGTEALHFDMVAEMMGFESGHDLITQLENVKDKEITIKSIVDSRMMELHPEMIDSEQEIQDAAQKAIHDEKRSELLRLEMEMLQELSPAVYKDVIKRLVRRTPSDKAVKDQARGIIARKTVKSIQPHIYQQGEARAAKEAGIALANGQFDKAFEAKQKELLNHELYRAAVAAREYVEDALYKFKDLNQADSTLAKSRDVDYINAARAILAQYGLGKTDKLPGDYVKAIKAYDPDTYESVSSVIEAATEGSGHYKTVSFDQFVTLKDTIDTLWDLSKSKREMVIDGQALDREIVKAELQARIDEMGLPVHRIGYDKAVSDWEKAKMHLLGMRASLRRVESWVDAMDSGDPNGVFRKFIFNPISQAATKYRLAKADVLKNYLDIVKGVEKSLTNKEIAAPEIGYRFKGKSELLGAILHTGNESNMAKLLRGRGWGDVDQDGNIILSRWQAFVERMWKEGTLTKADYDYVQAVWDLYESIKPESQRAHKRMYGHYFNEITAEPIVTPFGTYRGGYAPAIVDPFISQDAAIRNEKEALEKSNNSFMFPTAGRGFTKSRVEQYSAPLMLDVALVPMQIDKVMRFIHIEPAIKDVSRIVMDRGFRKTLDALDPTIGGDMLVPWLQRAAQQKVSNPSQGWGGKGLDTFARELRTRTGLQVMFANVTNTFQQFTGLSIAALKVQPKYLRDSLWNYVRAPKVTTDNIAQRSEFMRTRVATQVMEIQDHIDEMLLNPSKYEKVRSFAQKHGYFLQSATQNIVDIVVWSGAYDEAIAKGSDEKLAVQIADSAVRQTQGTMSAEDISRFETGTPFMRLFTMFYSYFNMQANLLGTEFTKTYREMGLRKGAGKMFFIYTMGFMIPAVISELMVRAMSGKGIDEDDDDEYMTDLMAIFFGSQIRSGLAMAPVAGTVGNGLLNSFNDKAYDDRISTSPVVNTIERTVSAPASVYEAITGDGSKKKAAGDALTALGLLTGLPLAPLSKPFGYLDDVAEGNTQPSGPFDFARGLVTGKSPRR